MTLLHAAEQLTTAEYVTEEAACDCTLTVDTGLEDLIDYASDVMAIMSNGWIKGRGIHTYRPVWGEGECWPLDEWAFGLDDGIPLPHNASDVVVTIDGVALTQAQMSVIHDPGFADPKLVRVDSTTYMRQSWPRTNKPFAPLSETGVFEVQWISGVGPEEPAVMAAAAELVCHLSKDFDPQTEIRRTKADQVSAGGASIQRRQHAEKIKQGQFDLRLVDRALKMFDLSGSATVWSPELAGPWRMLAVDDVPVPTP